MWYSDCVGSLLNFFEIGHDSLTLQPCDKNLVPSILFKKLLHLSTS